MDSHKAAIFMLVLCAFLCFDPSNGYRFHVGGKDGWVVRPSEDYSHWSHRNRFLINDTLYFKYSKGEESVLEVGKDQYYSCNSSNPLLKMDDGASGFKLRRSGPFFFINGVKDKCEKGQRLHVVVLSEHHHYRRSPAPSPSVHPPSTSPSPAPSSGHHQPAPAPASPPSKLSPAPAISPASAPAHSPASPSPAVSPAASPKPSPATPSPTTPASSPVTPPDDELPLAPAPAPAKNAASKILMALPVTIALMAFSIGAF